MNTTEISGMMKRKTGGNTRIFKTKRIGEKTGSLLIAAYMYPQAGMFFWV
jgi:hypothetical protein